MRTDPESWMCRLPDFDVDVEVLPHHVPQSTDAACEAVRYYQIDQDPAFARHVTDGYVRVDVDGVAHLVTGEIRIDLRASRVPS